MSSAENKLTNQSSLEEALFSDLNSSSVSNPEAVAIENELNEMFKGSTPMTNQPQVPKSFASIDISSQPTQKINVQQTTSQNQIQPQSNYPNPLPTNTKPQTPLMKGTMIPTTGMPNPITIIKPSTTPTPNIPSKGIPTSTGNTPSGITIGSPLGMVPPSSRPIPTGTKTGPITTNPGLKFFISTLIFSQL